MLRVSRCAPAAAHLGAAQRGHQVACLALQLALGTGQRLDLGAQPDERLAPLALERLDLRLGALECVAQRVDQLRNGELALLELPLGHGLLAPERLARQLQEQLAVGSQRLAGKRVEGRAQARLGLLEETQPVGLLQRGGLEARLRPGERHAQRLEAPRRTHVREQRAEQRSGEKRGERADADEGRAHRSRCAR
jgi:hypothetical protein